MRTMKEFKEMLSYECVSKEEHEKLTELLLMEGYTNEGWRSYDTNPILVTRSLYKGNFSSAHRGQKLPEHVTNASLKRFCTSTGIAYSPIVEEKKELNRKDYEELVASLRVEIKSQQAEIDYLNRELKYVRG